MRNERSNMRLAVIIVALCSLLTACASDAQNNSKATDISVTSETTTVSETEQSAYDKLSEEEKKLFDVLVKADFEDPTSVRVFHTGVQETGRHILGVEHEGDASVHFLTVSLKNSYGANEMVSIGILVTNPSSNHSTEFEGNNLTEPLSYLMAYGKKGDYVVIKEKGEEKSLSDLANGVPFDETMNYDWCLKDNYGDPANINNALDEYWAKKGF